MSIRQGEIMWGYILIAPTVIGLGVFYLWPVVQTLYISMTKQGPFGGSSWAGVSNFERLATPEFGQSLLNTLGYTAIVVFLGVPVATVLAAMLSTTKLRFRVFYRAAFFIPVITLPAAIGVLWRWIYNTDYGILNQILRFFGLNGSSWISDPNIALYSIAVVGVWMTVGYNIVIIAAGIQEVPVWYHEAAMLDGAGAVRRFFSITLPAISPTLFFVTVLAMIKALQVFDIVYLMVGDTSPAFDRVKPIVYYFYQSGFIENDKGFAAAVAIVLFILIASLTGIQFWVQKKWVQR